MLTQNILQALGYHMLKVFRSSWIRACQTLTAQNPKRPINPRYDSLNAKG